MIPHGVDLSLYEQSYDFDHASNTLWIATFRCLSTMGFTAITRIWRRFVSLPQSYCRDWPTGVSAQGARHWTGSAAGAGP